MEPTGEIFVLWEIVQLDRKSWLRIPLAVLCFLGVCALAICAMKFVPGLSDWPPSIAGPASGVLILIGTFTSASSLFEMVGLSDRSAGIHLVLGKDEIQVQNTKSSPTSVKNRNLRYIRTRRFHLEIESPDHGIFQVPELVELRNVNEYTKSVINEGVLVLRVVDGQLRLAVQFYDVVGLGSGRLIDF